MIFMQLYLHHYSCTIDLIILLSLLASAHLFCYLCFLYIAKCNCYSGCLLASERPGGWGGLL